MTVSINVVDAVLLKRQLAQKPCVNLARPCAMRCFAENWANMSGDFVKSITHIETDTQAHNQSNKQTIRNRIRNRNRNTNPKTHSHRQTQTNRHTDRHRQTQTDRQHTHACTNSWC